ncbi:DUF7503 family protein [Haladaptatus caseinilyticus]|nr:hypothetical protein [Haladaptatus caseinilyticus]
MVQNVLLDSLESNPRMISILFTASLLLMQAGTALACCGGANPGP